MSTSNKVKVVHFAVGLDLIGSKTSLTSTKYDIIATAIGIQAVSKSTGRTIVVPYPNVKGFELLDDAPDSSIRAPAAARAEQAMLEARAMESKRSQQAAVAVPSVPELSEEEQLEIASEARKAAKKAARLAAEASNAGQALKK